MSGERCITCTDIRTCRDSVVFHVRIYEHVGIALYYMFNSRRLAQYIESTATSGTPIGEH